MFHTQNLRSCSCPFQNIVLTVTKAEQCRRQSCPTFGMLTHFYGMSRTCIFKHLRKKQNRLLPPISWDFITASLLINRNQWRVKPFALKSDRRAVWDLSPLTVSSSIYQKGVSFKQEFHTLLTMWLLSAAASSPITNSSSFFPNLGVLSFSLADFCV